MGVTVLFFFQIDRPEFGVKRELLVEKRNTVRIPYYNYMVDMAVTFGANRTVAELEMAQALSLEVLLAKVGFWFSFC